MTSEHGAQIDRQRYVMSRGSYVSPTWSTVDKLPARARAKLPRCLNKARENMGLIQFGHSVGRFSSITNISLNVSPRGRGGIRPVGAGRLMTLQNMEGFWG